MQNSKPLNTTADSAEQGGFDSALHSIDHDDAHSRTVGEIRSHAEELGLPPDDAEAAVADYLSGQKEVADHSETPEIIQGELAATEEKLVEVGLGLEGVKAGLENMAADVGELLDALKKILVIIENYLDKIANENDPQKKKVLIAELQEKINKFGH